MNQTILPTTSPPRASASPDAQAREKALRGAAQKLESAFLAEMLKAARIGEPRDSMGGGIGEAQFASFLRQAQADELAKDGMLGLTDALFRALSERSTQMEGQAAHG